MTATVRKQWLVVGGAASNGSKRADGVRAAFVGHRPTLCQEQERTDRAGCDSLEWTGGSHVAASGQGANFAAMDHFQEVVLRSSWEEVQGDTNKVLDHV
ncbi:MAG: hypothetical protein M1830_008886 [Pleopsidium flavum]|nr:MAG: hypothetical protein M1830_008886 [Pleopsidium flavum]